MQTSCDQTARFAALHCCSFASGSACLFIWYGWIVEWADDLRSVSTERALLATQLRTGEMELTMVVRQRDRYLHRWHGSRATLRGMRAPPPPFACCFEGDKYIIELMMTIELRRVFRDELNRIATALGMRGGGKDEKSSSTLTSTIAAPTDTIGDTKRVSPKNNGNTTNGDTDEPESLHTQLQRLSMLAAELDSSLDDDSDLDDSDTAMLPSTATTTDGRRRVSPQHHRRRRSQSGHTGDGTSRSKSRDGRSSTARPSSSSVSTAVTTPSISGATSPQSPRSPRSNGDVTPPIRRSPDYSPQLSGDDESNATVLVGGGGRGNGRSYRSSSNGGPLDETFRHLAARLGVDLFSETDADTDTNANQSQSTSSSASSGGQRGLPAPPSTSSSASASRGRPRRTAEV
jgi:hypothetical protein